jgi:hypothetical protein
MKEVRSRIFLKTQKIMHDGPRKKGSIKLTIQFFAELHPIEPIKILYALFLSGLTILFPEHLGKQMLPHSSCQRHRTLTGGRVLECILKRMTHSQHTPREKLKLK